MMPTPRLKLAAAPRIFSEKRLFEGRKPLRFPSTILLMTDSESLDGVDIVVELQQAECNKAHTIETNRQGENLGITIRPCSRGCCVGDGVSFAVNTITKFTGRTCTLCCSPAVKFETQIALYISYSRFVYQHSTASQTFHGMLEKSWSSSGKRGKKSKPSKRIEVETGRKGDSMSTTPSLC